jgi:serpin B
VDSLLNYRGVPARLNDMRTHLLLAGIIVAATLLSAHAQPCERFATELMSRWCNGSENAVFSPFSLSAALAMTATGARGETAEQITKALGLPPGPEELCAAFQGIDKALAESRGASPGLVFSVANALFPQQDYMVKPAFLERVRIRFKGETMPLNYAVNPEAARQAINRWVEARTAERIKDLIAPGVLTRATRMTLANAIYFKGRWATPFDAAQTQPAPFSAPGNVTVQAPLMHRRGQMRYTERNGLQAVDLPYAGDRFAMLVLLPGPDKSIRDAVKNLADGGLRGWDSALAEADVTLFLPRFTCMWEMECTRTLQAMGINNLFDAAKVDLSGIAGQPGELTVSAVVHKAFVEVAEEGTEAAAATGVVMRTTAFRPPERNVVFRADRPFVYLIRERGSGCMLFAGVVNKP